MCLSTPIHVPLAQMEHPYRAMLCFMLHNWVLTLLSSVLDTSQSSSMLVRTVGECLWTKEANVRSVGDASLAQRYSPGLLNHNTAAVANIRTELGNIKTQLRNMEQDNKDMAYAPMIPVSCICPLPPCPRPPTPCQPPGTCPMFRNPVISYLLLQWLSKLALLALALCSLWLFCWASVLGSPPPPIPP